MKKYLPLLGSLFVLAAFGCHGNDAPADDKALRAALTQKEINTDNIPIQNRQMVLNAMRAHGPSTKADELEAKWGMKK